MNYVNDENFYNVQGWMMTRLGLKGNELLIYAIIYGFSQTDNQNFTGSLQYLANWTNSTTRGVQKNLKSLVDKHLIEKIERYENGVKFVEYHRTKFQGGIEQSSPGYGTEFQGGIEQSSPGYGTEFQGGIEQSSNNNINNTIKDNISNTIKDNKSISDVQQVVELYNETCVSYPHLRSVSEARKKAIKARLRVYELNDFKVLFQKAEASSFLKGGNGRNWSATFDWLIKDSNMAKVLDGNYDDKNNRQFGRNGVEILPESERLHDLDEIF